MKIAKDKTDTKFRKNFATRVRNKSWITKKLENLSVRRFLKIGFLSSSLLLCLAVFLSSLNTSTPTIIDFLATAKPTIYEVDNMLNARFVGLDKNKRAYVVVASKAEQDLQDKNIIRLSKPSADLELDNGGWMMISSIKGIIYKNLNTLNLEGNVDIFTNSGTEMHTKSATYNLKDKIVKGNELVNAHGSWGKISGVGFEYVSDNDIFTIYGRPTLNLNPRIK